MSHFCFFMCNQNFYGISQKLLPTKAAAAAPSPHSIFLSNIGLWVERWHRTKKHIRNWILCKAASLYQRPVLGKGVCSDSNRTAQRLQMAARKSLETMSGVILNRLQPKFAAKSVANEMLCLKLESHVVTSVDRMSFNFRFEDFLSNLPL